MVYCYKCGYIMKADESDYLCENCGGTYVFRPSYVIEDGKKYIKTKDLYYMSDVLKKKGVFTHSQLLRMSGEDIIKEYNKFLCNEEEE